MTEFFQVKPIEGKGFGIVATKFIKRGTLILQEEPQIQIEAPPGDEDDVMPSLRNNPELWVIWIRYRLYIT